MKYVCEQFYYKNGTIKSFVYKSDQLKEDKYKIENEYDHYIDLFDTLNQAIQFQNIVSKVSI